MSLLFLDTTIQLEILSVANEDTTITFCHLSKICTYLVIFPFRHNTELDHIVIVSDKGNRNGLQRLFFVKHAFKDVKSHFCQLIIEYTNKVKKRQLVELVGSTISNSYLSYVPPPLHFSNTLAVFLCWSVCPL